MHLMAYSASLANGTTLLDVAAVQDQAITRQQSHFILSAPRRVIWAYGQSTTLQRVRFNYPALRRVILPFLRPLDRGTAPGDQPNIAWFGEQQLILAADEELAVEAVHGGAGAEQVTIGVSSTDGPMVTVPGQSFTARCTMSITAVANTWTLGDLTFTETLPGGRYAVVGMEVIETTTVFARLVLPAQAWRPGTLGSANNGQDPGERFHKGALGVWGEFISTALPQCEILANAAGAITPEVYLDLVKIG